MPESCKFPSLDSCQKRFLWTHKRTDLARHSVVGPVLQIGNVKKFPQPLGFESLDPFFPKPVSRVHVSQPQRRMKVTRDLYNLNLLAKLMVLFRQILLNLAIAAITEAILKQA